MAKKKSYAQICDIVRRGSAVQYNGKLICSEADLPSELEYAGNDPDKQEAILTNLLNEERILQEKLSLARKLQAARDEGEKERGAQMIVQGTFIPEQKPDIDLSPRPVTTQTNSGLQVTQTPPQQPQKPVVQGDLTDSNIDTGTPADGAANEGAADGNTPEAGNTPTAAQTAAQKKAAKEAAEKAGSANAG